MSFEDRLRDDLRAVIGPAPLPPPNLADLALAGARRQTYRRAAVTTGLALVAVGSVTAAASAVMPGGPPPATTPPAGPTLGSSCLVEVTPPATPPSVPTSSADPVFPAPGGGARAVEVYGTRFSPDAGSYLLDLTDGTYHALPWLVSVSPDGTQVAVFDDGQGRVGLADRSALLAQGEAAITWLELPRSNGPLWSPDGTALLSTTTIRDATDHIGFVVTRYDIATGEQTTTQIPWGDQLVGSRVGWAADSQGYLAMIREIDDEGREVAGPVQYLNPDGTPGASIDVPGGLVGGAEAYSPSRRYLILDASGVMLEERACSRIVDVTTGEAVVVFAPGEIPVGWYSETAFVRQKDGVLQVVDLATLAVLKEVDLSGVGTLAPLQLGPSDGTAAPGF